MKFTLAAIVATVALLAYAGATAVAQTPAVDVCANIPGDQLTPPANFQTIIVRYAEEPRQRSECVRIPATATPSPVATPVTVTNTVVIQCEGPYDYNAPYAAFTNVGYGYGMNPLLYNPLSFNVPGLAAYPYAGGYNWPVPTLVTRTNNVVTFAVPNAPQCMPVAATSTPDPAATPAPQIIVVQQPAATPAPVQSAPSTPPSVIRAPNTGDGGLAY